MADPQQKLRTLKKSQLFEFPFILLGTLKFWNTYALAGMSVAALHPSLATTMFRYRALTDWLL